jgi:DNA uptake protein ComE-like DNA-binding protein
MADPERIFLNRANRQQLESVEYFDRDIIDAILNHRRKHGKFGSIEELETLEGFDKASLELIRKRVMVSN